MLFAIAGLANQTDYYNSDDEDENLIDSAIPPNFFTNYTPIIIP